MMPDYVYVSNLTYLGHALLLSKPNGHIFSWLMWYMPSKAYRFNLVQCRVMFEETP